MSPLFEFLLFLGLLVTGIILFISVLRIPPALTLGIAALVSGWVLGLPFPSILLTMLEGFLSILLGIGLVIALGALLGTLMETSGALDLLIHYSLSLFGRNRPLVALSVLGIIVGIPVFCDSGFVILSSTADKIEKQFNLKHGIPAVALAGGLYTSHTLIPPTPGPVAAAANLGLSANLGYVLLSGLAVGAVLVIVLVLLTRFYAGKQTGQSAGILIREGLSSRLLFPIIISLGLIGAGSVIGLTGITGIPGEILNVITHPLSALGLACLIAWWQVPKAKKTTSLVFSGLRAALPIILITAMGGAFGQILKQSQMAEILENTFAETGGSVAGLLIIGYVVALILKSAQGSSTAAMVITSSIMFPLLTVINLSTWDTALLVSSIGSGALAISHANDSFFWVVTRFSNMTVREGYLKFSLITLALSISGLAACLMLHLL